MPRFLFFWIIAAFLIISFIAMNTYGGELIPFLKRNTPVSNEISPDPQDWLAQTIQEHDNEQIDINILDPCSIAASLSKSAQISQCGPSLPED